MQGNSPDEEHIDIHGECNTEIHHLQAQLVVSEKRAEEIEHAKMRLALDRDEWKAYAERYEDQALTAISKRDEARSSLMRVRGALEMVVEALPDYALYVAGKNINPRAVARSALQASGDGT